jgi:hypothetical protein
VRGTRSSRRGIASFRQILGRKVRRGAVIDVRARKAGYRDYHARITVIANQRRDVGIVVKKLS